MPENQTDTKSLTLQIADEIALQQGEDIVVLDVSGPLVIADYFVVATAKSHRHAVAIARELERAWKAHGGRRLNTAGAEGDSPWILLDFDLVVVHLFEPEARGFYALEQLWGDAPRVEYTPSEAVTAAAAAATPLEGDAGGIDFDDEEEFPGGRFTGSIFTEGSATKSDGDTDGEVDSEDPDEN